MFRKSDGKVIGPAVMQTRAPPTMGGVSGLIWTEGATRDASAHPNAAGRPPGISIEGTVTGDADISLNGRIKGDVNVTSLTVDDEGVIEGSITAEQVEVHGRVTGNIHAEVIKLHPQSVVHGDLTYSQLAIELGAEFQGACRQIPKPVPVALPVVAAPVADEADLTAPAPPVDMHDVPTEVQLQSAAKPEMAGAAAAKKGEGLLN